MVEREKDTFVIARRKKGHGCFASKWGISTSTTYYTNWELFSQGDIQHQRVCIYIERLG